MQSQIRLGRIFGVEIGLHYSWFIIAFLVTLSLGTQFSAANPAWGTGTIWATAILTGLLFFVAIILHELSHAAVAKARGLPVRSITLFARGGIAQIERESADAKTEFWMGIIGPIASAVIGFICLAAAWILGWTLTLTPATPLVAMLVWLGVINIGLAIFNMPLVSALETMSADHVNQLPVVREGRLAGVISRKHILQMLRMRGELQI